MCRIEFDAYRVDLEQLRTMPRDSNVVARIDAAEKKFDIHRDKYERVKADLIVKLKFLDVNRVSDWVYCAYCTRRQQNRVSNWVMVYAVLGEFYRL